LAPAEATTTTTAAPATTATTAAPATTPTTHAPTQSCGTGQISARASVATKPTSPADGTWTSTGTVQVTNGTDKSMQIDRLVAHLEYADGTFDVIDVGAAGVVLSPGQVSNFDFTKRTARQPTTVTVSDFAAHPVGHPECATQPA
jgi:hypothetical protein